jgi:chemosensory pili system protein ChpC
MNSTESAGNKTLRCLLMPLKDYNLIVPHSSVDEILPFAVVEDDEEEGFIIGRLLWRRESIPLVSFEVLNKEEKPEIRRRTRAAVMHVNSTDTGVHNFAIILSGMPKMLVISESDLMEMDEERLPHCTSRKVDINKTIAYIPDLDALEYILHKKLKTQ